MALNSLYRPDWLQNSLLLLPPRCQDYKLSHNACFMPRWWLNPIKCSTNWAPRRLETHFSQVGLFQRSRPSPINPSSNSKRLGSRVNCLHLDSGFHTDVFARQDFILRSVKAIFLLCCISSLATEVPVIWNKLQNYRKTQIIPIVYKSFSFISVRNLSHGVSICPDSCIPAE